VQDEVWSPQIISVGVNARRIEKVRDIVKRVRRIFCFINYDVIISIPSLCFSGWSFPTGCLVRTSIALMNLSPMSVCNEYAKSRAVVFCGRRKQSGRTFPFESASFAPAGNIAMYFRRSNTA